MGAVIHSQNAILKNAIFNLYHHSSIFSANADFSIRLPPCHSEQSAEYFHSFSQYVVPFAEKALLP